MPRVFPPNPSLEFDRKQAKALLDALHAKDAAALQRFVAHHPQHKGATDPTALTTTADLHDAQLVVAREYGLPSWRALVEKIQQIEVEHFRQAIEKNDAARVRKLLETSEHLRSKINDPIGGFGARPVHVASKSPEVIDVLLEFGADINLRTDWDKGPFSVLDSAPEEAARLYIARGATLTAHAAARLGWIDELRKIVTSNPAIVHEKGGDGQRPLHFAKTLVIADLLLDHGADIDARCDDHHSTPAQYALAERPDVCRHLLNRGATPDIFMAARLGDEAMTDLLVDADPACLAARINAAGYEPVPKFNIYCWSIGWYLSPHEVALKFGHRALYQRLLDRSPASVRLLVACSQADEPAARTLLRDHPHLVTQLPPSDQSLLPYSMYYDRPGAVKLMLSLGFDTASFLSAHGMEGGTLLHIASWHGNAEIVEILLRDYRDRVELELKDPAYNGTPLNWAIHGSKNSWAKGSDHAAVTRLLLDAGAKPPDRVHEASDAVRAVLNAHGVPDENETA